MNNKLSQMPNHYKRVLCSGFLAPYLPYSVKIEHPTLMIGKRKISELYSIKELHIEIQHRMYVEISQCKLILKPLTDYSEILEITDEMNDYEIQMIEDNPDMIKRLGYDVIEKMLKHHIDIFGLIPQGLAVSIHDVV